MAISRVQQADSGFIVGAAVTSRSVTLPSTPAAGNLLVVIANVATADSNVSISGTGWTRQIAVTYPGGSWSMSIWYKIAGASEPSTITVTSSTSTRIGVWAAEYSGVDTAAPVDVSYGGASYARSPRPAYRQGLGILFVGGQDQFSNTDDMLLTDKASHPSGIAQYGRDIGHRLSTNDSIKIRGRVYDIIQSGSPADEPVDAEIDGVSRLMGAAIIFKAAGASASRAHFSGSSSVTAIQSQAAYSNTGMGGGISLTNNPTPGNVLMFAVSTSGTTINHDTRLTPLGELFALPGGGRMRLFYRVVQPGDGKGWNFNFDNNSARAIAVVEYNAAPPGNEVAYHAHERANASSITPPIRIGSMAHERESATDGVAFCAVFSGNASLNAGTALDDGWVRRVGTGNSGASITVFDRFGSVNTLVCFGGEFTATGSTVWTNCTTAMVHFVAKGSDHWAWAEESADSWGVAV
jgi:hypothetical protein